MLDKNLKKYIFNQFCQLNVVEVKYCILLFSQIATITLVLYTFNELRDMFMRV